MNKMAVSAVAGIVLFITITGHASTPETIPTGATRQRTNEADYSAASKCGACTGHKRIKMSFKAGPTTPTSGPVAMALRPLIDADQVSTNIRSHACHCPSDNLYVKTKQAARLTAAQTQSKSLHAAHDTGHR